MHTYMYIHAYIHVHVHLTVYHTQVVYTEQVQHSPPGVSRRAGSWVRRWSPDHRYHRHRGSWSGRKTRQTWRPTAGHLQMDRNWTPSDMVANYSQRTLRSWRPYPVLARRTKWPSLVRGPSSLSRTWRPKTWQTHSRGCSEVVVWHVHNNHSSYCIECENLLIAKCDFSLDCKRKTRKEESIRLCTFSQ